jgi:uncharacterized protein
MAMDEDSLQKLFGTRRPVIGMVHFPPLPRTALYDSAGGMDRLLSAVKRDVDVLVEAGFDAVMFCNEGDLPYSLTGNLEAVSAMSAVIAQVAPSGIPFGVDYLWDPMAALAMAHATGAAFVREVFTGTYESDMGLWSLDPSRILRYRTELGAKGVKLFMNVTPEFASALGDRSVGIRARSAVVNGLADVILVAGRLAGDLPDRADLDDAKKLLAGAAPVFVNTGVSAETVGQSLQDFDGVIVGTSLKFDNYTWNPVDPERAKEFMRRAKAARKD